MDVEEEIKDDLVKLNAIQLSLAQIRDTITANQRELQDIRQYLMRRLSLLNQKAIKPT